MTEPTKNPVLSDSAALLLGYGFDLGVFEVDELVSYWSSHYPPHWLRAAILEALHQGRYKAISVGQILVIWRRRGQPLPHYSYEFERAVSSRFPPSRGNSSSLAMASPASTAAHDAPDSGHGSEMAVARLHGARSASPDSVERAPLKPSVEIESVEIESSDVESSDAESSDAESSDVESSDVESLDAEIERSHVEIESSKIQNIEIADSNGEPQNRSQATPATDPEAICAPRRQATAPASITAAGLSTATASTEDEALELWCRASIMHLPIHQYVPIVPRFETSTFYAKLRAVASDEML